MKNLYKFPDVFSDRISLPYDFLKLLILASVYFMAHGIAFFFPDSGKVIMLIWPASGIALAAFLLNPRRLWPVLTLAFYLTGIAADIFLAHRPFLSGVGYMTASMVESVSCAWFIIYISRDFKRFTNYREVLALIAGAVSINALSACIGAGTIVLTQEVSFLESWRSWYIVDGLGILLITPLIVSWIGNFKSAIGGLKLKKIIESIAFLLIWTLISYVIFFQKDSVIVWGFHRYILVALLAWPVVRFRMRGVTLAIMILFIISIFSKGIFDANSHWAGRNTITAQALLQDQVFLVFLAFVGYLLSAFYSGLRLAEGLLRKSEERYRDIFETAMDGFWVADKKGNILQVNDAYCRMIGYSRSELLNMNISDIETKESDVEIAERIQKIMSVGEDHFETIHRLKDGGFINLEINTKYYPGEAGGIVAFLHDITVRIIIEDALNKKLDELQKFQKLTVGRELDMLKLKKEINELMVKSGQNEKYRIVA